jgi:hypothetical protein
MDPGMNDKTGILYAHVDFLQKKLVIEGEDLLTRAETLTIADAIKLKEAYLWEGRQPCLRICDVDVRLRRELWSLHGLNFVNAYKPDSAAGINLVRVMMRQHQIIIHPTCHQAHPPAGERGLGRQGHRSRQDGGRRALRPGCGAEIPVSRHQLAEKPLPRGLQPARPGALGVAQAEEEARNRDLG